MATMAWKTGKWTGSDSCQASGESRRYVGDYVITQNDVEAEGRFDDIIAYGAGRWTTTSRRAFTTTVATRRFTILAPSPWGVPYRCLYSKNIKNLLFAGRNISVTHAALSSSRVMGTCSLLGQALGTAVAIAVKDGVPLRGVDTAKLQQQLMEDDCWIPWHTRELPPLTKRRASTQKSSRQRHRPGNGRGLQRLCRQRR